MRNQIYKSMWRLPSWSRHTLGFLLASLALGMAQYPLHAQGQSPLGLNFSGDFRVRYERTTKQEPGEVPDVISDPRNREVVRFRFGINKKINGLFNFGARLATGSPDDPNTTDVTLGDFVNDLAISLDRAYLEFAYKGLFFSGGKFANPFLITELVWDGDVNPQGIAGSYTFKGSEKIVPKFIVVYSIVDEQTANKDSYMIGGQLQLMFKPQPDWSMTLAGAYYDYKIHSLINAGTGDLLSNNLISNGSAYLSDFDLLDIIAMVEYRGLSQRFPLRFVGDFVKNNGAELNEDTGLGLDLYVGKTSNKNDVRFQYGYSKAETDAVLAAFSHDNTTIATNYQQHTFGVDFVAVENTVLNMTLYFYRRNEVAGFPGDENEFFTRLRLNALISF